MEEPVGERFFALRRLADFKRTLGGLDAHCSVQIEPRPLGGTFGAADKFADDDFSVLAGLPKST